MENINIGINEQIITGRKYRRLIDKATKLWQRISWWTKASDVEFDDGKNAEQKLGNINGITSDFFINDESIAASSNLTNRAYTRFNEFTDNGRVKGIIIGEDGNPYIEYCDEDGADTVLKKLGSVDEDELINSISDKTTNEYTKGTWLCIVSSSATTSANSVSFSDTCSITDPDINSIKRIYVKENTTKTEAGHDDDNNKCYIGSRLYLIIVNTETANVSLSYNPSTTSLPRRVQHNKCKVKLSN